MAARKSRTWLIVLIILIVVLTGLYFWWRSKRVPGNDGIAPQLSVVALRVKNISNENILMESDAVVKNNFPVTLVANNLRMKISFDTLLLIETASDKQLRIESMDSSSITLPMELKAAATKAMIAYLGAHPDIDSIDVKMQTVINLDVPVAGERTFTIDREVRIPVIRMPDLALGKVDLQKLGLNNSEIDVPIQLYNVNKQPIRLSDAKFTFTVDKENTFSGDLEPLDLPAKGRDTVLTHIDVRTLKLGKLGWKYLFAKDDTHFQMRINGKLKMENKVLNESNLELTVTGTLKELRDASVFFAK